MPDTQSFEAFVAGVRRGDPEAARRFLAEYEPEVRRLVRFRMTDPRLRRTLDSIDICQSVFGSFFVRAAAGEFELTDPRDLIKVLVTMTQNKVRHAARRERAQKRDVSRLAVEGQEALGGVAADTESPSKFVEGQDLLAAVKSRLTDEERRLAEARAEGRPWDELAVEFSKGAEALRKQHARALTRVLTELGMQDDGAAEE